MENPYFKKAEKKAEDALKNKWRISSILKNVNEKLSSANLDMSKMGEKIKIMMRMVKAYVSGNYKIIPWKSIIVVTAVLIYFLMPFDLIADFIPVTGYIDDFSLILWVFNHLQDDIKTFIWWEQQTQEV